MHVSSGSPGNALRKNFGQAFVRYGVERIFVVIQPAGPLQAAARAELLFALGRGPGQTEQMGWRREF